MKQTVMYYTFYKNIVKCKKYYTNCVTQNV